jgi:hypothetical protein
MDDYLSIYAEILNEICPISAKNFPKVFNEKLSHYIKKGDTKTIKNHRTENVNKLLGMIFEKDGIIYLSERTLKFIESKDQPAFFKSVCFRFQQPNGSQKIQTVKEKIKNGINFKPYHFILALLKLAQNKDITLTRDEIAFYVLNSLQVLQKKISIEDVLTKILYNRENKITKKITPKNSRNYQHINEQFDYLRLANLIRCNREEIWINKKEMAAIDFFINDLERPLGFDFSNYNLSEKNIGKKIEPEWQNYFSSFEKIEEEKFKTSIKSLDTIQAQIEQTEEFEKSSFKIGEEGENFVLQIEKKIIEKFNRRLLNKVNYHGKMKGLGYDITSIEANRNPKNPEFLRHIEVKATKRVNAPNFTDTYDSINLTRNEWVAAEQHSKHYYIYRVYFTNGGIFISIINDPANKKNGEILRVTPIGYRIEFKDKAINETLKSTDEKLEYSSNGKSDFI